MHGDKYSRTTVSFGVVEAKFHYASCFEAGSELVCSWLEAGSKQVRSWFEAGSNLSATSFEPASTS